MAKHMLHMAQGTTNVTQLPAHAFQFVTSSTCTTGSARVLEPVLLPMYCGHFVDMLQFTAGGSVQI